MVGDEDVGAVGVDVAVDQVAMVLFSKVPDKVKKCCIACLIDIEAQKALPTKSFILVFLKHGQSFVYDIDLGYRCFSPILPLGNELVFHLISTASSVRIYYIFFGLCNSDICL